MNQQRYLDPAYGEQFKLEHLADSMGVTTTEEMKRKGNYGHARLAARLIQLVIKCGDPGDREEIY